MSEISIIAAVDEANGLGFNNQLLCHLPADLQHFKSVTMGKPIIMGRNTFESIGKALPGRLNIVLSHRLINPDGVTVVNSIEQAIKITEEYPEIMIIGGAQLYAQTIDLATRLYITRIHHLFPADVFFPEIDKKVWSCSKQVFRQHDEKNRYDMTVYIYERSP